MKAGVFMKEVKGNVFNIQRFTIHDGPGVRTEFFLKGCPLSCIWCSNPESQNPKIELGVYKKKCIGLKKCGGCASVCPSGALNFYRNKLVFINYDVCKGCHKCYEECPSDAIKVWGKMMSVEECMKVARADKGYYDRSGGGVTVSGGEPLLQADFVAELFKACKEEDINTCFESTFFGDWNKVEKVLPYTDLFISDIKHMDTDIHKKYTGAPNELILENLIKLSKTEKPIIIRIPVIPNVNDDMGNIKNTADFLLNEMQGKVRTLQLLSYMRLGEEKYMSINKEYEMADVKLNRKSFQKHIEEIAEYFNGRGIHALVGTKEKE